jgi:type II secretory pathway component GspD/PulD (secretin)
MARRYRVLAAAIGLLGLVPLTVQAQTTAPGKTASPGGKSGSLLVTLAVKDAPLRQVLKRLFNTAKVDYWIDNRVTGYVTLRVTEQPFDNTLRLVLRSSPIPLTYTVENGVYIVKPRPSDNLAPSVAPPPSPPRPAALPRGATRSQNFAVIPLTYLDPADLAQVLGITFIPTFSRHSGRGGGPYNAGRGNTDSWFIDSLGNYWTYTLGGGYGNFTPAAPGRANTGSGNTGARP